MKYSGMYLRTCDIKDLDAILALQDHVISGLADKSWLRKNPPEIFALALAAPNLTIGMFVKDELIAIGMLVDPRPPETDLRANLQKFKVDKALDMKLAMVRSDYRGRGLQKAVIWIMEKYSHSLGYKYLCTSVSPDNIYSLRNTLDSGFEFDHREELYGGLLRNVYVKKLTVSDYVHGLSEKAKRLAGTHYSVTATELSDYISAGNDLCLAGDMMRYSKTESDENVYGILLDSVAGEILFPDDSGNWTITGFAPEINSWRFREHLIGTSPSL